MKIEIEQTDTFGGEANYGWVKRKTLTLPDNLSNRAIVRRAKQAMGLSGVRCRSYSWNDTIELRPIGCCQVVFIDFKYEN